MSARARTAAVSAVARAWMLPPGRKGSRPISNHRLMKSRVSKGAVLQLDGMQGQQ